MAALNIVDFSIISLVLISILVHFKDGLFAIFRKVAGLVVGLALILFILVFVPIVPSMQKPIAESQVGSVLVGQVVALENAVNSAFGEATHKARTFLEISPGEDESLALPFIPPKLTVDARAEEQMLELVNKERREAGLSPLVMDQSLVEVARKHSYDMWQRKYFAHRNPEGDTPFDRLEEGRVEFRRAGENLALARNVRRAHEGLMNSEGHKKNILDPNFTRVGIGVIDGGIYGKMFTQNFAD